MTIFNDLNAAREYARAYDRAATMMAFFPMMSIALLDNGQYAVAHIHWLYELRECVVEFVPKEEPA